MSGAGLRGAAVLVFVLGATWLATASSTPIVTVAQSDPRRSPRSPRTADVSADGGTVVFQSMARLVAADTDDDADVYALDRETGRVTLESGAEGDRTEHTHPRTSGDGRFLVFESLRHGAAGAEITFRDRLTGAVRVLTGHDRREDPPRWSRCPVISADGRLIAFSSASTTLVGGTDANGALEDVYLVTMPAAAVTRVSVSSAGAQMNTGNSILPSLSGNGRWIAFASTAPLVESGRANPGRPVRQIYLRDLMSGQTTRVTRAANGGPANGDSSLPSISGDGRYVAFASDASNLLDDDQNEETDILLYDRDTDAISWVSRGADGSSANGASLSPAISADGRFVAFQSDASNLVCSRKCIGSNEDINLLWDVFLFDRTTGQIVRLSEDDLGEWMESSAGPALDGTGRIVAFSSKHPVDAADRRDDFDLFVRGVLTPSLVTRKGP